MRTRATSILYLKAGSQVDLDVCTESQSVLCAGGKKHMIEIYRAAMAKPYSFLTVDLFAKDPNKVFMKWFESNVVPQ